MLDCLRKEEVAVSEIILVTKGSLVQRFHFCCTYLPIWKFIYTKNKIVSGARVGCNSFSYSFKGIILDNSDIIEYYWDFGDNSTSIEKNPDHIFKNSGRYLVVLSVFDDVGNFGITKKEINVVNIGSCPCS